MKVPGTYMNKHGVEPAVVAANLSQIAHEETAAEFGAQWREMRHRQGKSTGLCVLTVRNALEAARHFGVPAEPVPVEVVAGNAAWWAWLSGEGEKRREEMPDEAWAVGMGPECPAPGGGLDGHLVLGLPTLATILDPTSGQMSRPERNMLVPEHLTFKADPSFFTNATAGEVLQSEDGSVTIVYRRNPAISTSWVESPDWNLRSEHAQATSERIIRRLEEAAR